jgi:hypothetical protein
MSPARPATPPDAEADLPRLLTRALRTDDESHLRDALCAASGLPGPRLNLRLIDEFADAIAAMVAADRSTDEIERLLDAWAAHTDAGPNDPAVILPCAAVVSYGAIGAARPEWWADEIAKLATAALDPRWRVRELVAAAAQRLLDSDWDRTVAAMLAWANDEQPLRVRAAVAAVAEPRLLTDALRWDDATAIQRTAIDWLIARPEQDRRTEDARTLRKALGYSLSVVAAASGDFGLLERAATSGDADLRWIAAENAKKKRLERWADQLESLRSKTTLRGDGDR